MASKRVLITGITGFAGSHLAEYLVSLGEYSINGTYLSEQSLSNVVSIRKKLSLTKLDLRDGTAVSAYIANLKPDFVFHLAALPAVGESFRNPLETITSNIATQLYILEGIKNAKLQTCRILAVTSADVYGKVSMKDIPIDEETPFNPTSPYAVSKIAADFLALEYVNVYKLDIVRVRPFNHIGPRQATGFVVGDFAKKIAEIEKGKISPVLLVGNVANKRDFTDVRDMVRAYYLLSQKGKSGDVYNIGSGKSYKIEKILEILLSFAKKKITIKTDPNLLRREDAPERTCDYSKFHVLTNWKPTIPIEITLKDTLDYWRNIV